MYWILAYIQVQGKIETYSTSFLHINTADWLKCWLDLIGGSFWTAWWKFENNGTKGRLDTSAEVFTTPSADCVTLKINDRYTWCRGEICFPCQHHVCVCFKWVVRSAHKQKKTKKKIHKKVNYKKQRKKYNTDEESTIQNILLRGKEKNLKPQVKKKELNYKLISPHSMVANGLVQAAISHTRKEVTSQQPR